MDLHEAETVREAIADNVRAIADIVDVLLAISVAARLAVETLEKAEQDLVNIAG
jgi:hypothetical protein